MSNELDYEKSSGNVFKDLGIPNPEERLAKAKLASKIIDLIKIRKLTQKKAASLLEIDQPKISALYRGQLSGFSISRLIKYLTLLDQDVEIVVRDKSDQNNHYGHLIVATNLNEKGTHTHQPGSAA